MLKNSEASQIAFAIHTVCVAFNTALLYNSMVKNGTMQALSCGIIGWVLSSSSVKFICVETQGYSDVCVL